MKILLCFVIMLLSSCGWRVQHVFIAESEELTTKSRVLVETEKTESIKPVNGEVQ